MPEYSWSRFAMCFYSKEKAQCSRNHTSNFKHHYYMRMYSVAKYSIRIISSAHVNQAKKRVNNMNSTTSYKANILMYI